MKVCRHVLIGSASCLALAFPAGSAFAAAADATSAPAPTDDIVVTGLRASLEKALEIKRSSDNHVEAISAMDIGKLPDKNVADALQRLPGVNTSSAASGEGGFDENDRVSIRGTSPSLTQVTIDGHSVSTGDWFILDQFSTVGRSISFDLLPSEIVQNVVVYKTQDASLLEGGVAGSIDIQTRAPLDLDKSLVFEASAQGAYNSQSHETKPQFNALLGWKNADETFGIIVQGFYEQRSVRRYGQETLGYTPITAAMPIGAANPTLIGVQAPTLIGSSLFKQEKTREGGVVAAEWRPSDRVEFKLSGFYSHLNATNSNDNYMYWGSNELNNNLPTAFTVKDNTLTSANWPLNGPAGTPVKGLIVDNIIRPDASGQSYFINLDGKFKLTDRLTVKAQVGFTRGVGNTPTEPAFEVDGATGISYAPSGNGWTVKPTDINPQSPAGLANDWAWNETFKSVDHELYGKFDAKFDIDSGVFKAIDFGMRVAQHERKVDGWDRGCSLGANGQCWTPAMPFSAVNPTSYPSGYNAGALGIPGLLIPIAGDPKAIIAALDGITDGVHGPISSIKTAVNYYWPGAFKVKETDVEGYIMAHIGGEGWRGNFGLRVTDTDENAYANISDPSGKAPGIITSSAYGPYYINHVSHNYVDFLPSMNFTFDLKKDVLLRISATETMSRPDFSALGGTVSLTDTNLTGNGGNPNLKPIKATVFDGALEWYYAPAAIAAVSVFHDELQSYVTFGTAQAVYFSQFYKSNQTYTISSPFNIGGELSGVELQVQQPVAYGFGFQANGTYVKGHDSAGNQLVGTSKFTYNLVAYYDKGPLSARIAYTYRSHYFVGLDRSSAENQDNYGTLDGSINLTVMPGVTLTVDALNLANAKLKYYAENRTQPRAVYANGTQVFFGVRTKF